MRTRKTYQHVVKSILRPEITRCLSCQTPLRRCSTISDRTVITLTQIRRIIHCGYRCPLAQCPGRNTVYRSVQADELALAGFTFGLDIVLRVGHLRLAKHCTIDEIHQHLLEQLAPLQQSISRREILFLFEAYCALLRAGTEVQEDEEWKSQVRRHGGLLLSIDGIQPDAGNETIYLVRDVWTGRLIVAENTSESSAQRLQELLSPVLTLGLPVLGVISDAQSTELQAVAHWWPEVPHQICHFHALRDASRLIFQADTRVRNDLRAQIKEKTQKYHHHLRRKLQIIEKQPEMNEQEGAQLHLLEDYAALIEGTLQIGSRSPFEYGGLATDEALTHLQSSLETLEKKGASLAPSATNVSADSAAL